MIDRSERKSAENPDESSGKLYRTPETGFIELLP
jgi:hypothetical protein